VTFEDHLMLMLGYRQVELSGSKGGNDHRSSSKPMDDCQKLTRLVIRDIGNLKCSYP
jgi:hypothetical protein